VSIVKISHDEKYRDDRYFSIPKRDMIT